MARTARRAVVIAILAAALGASAEAADIPMGYTAPAPISAYSWTGPYLGGHLGYQWGNVTGSSADPWGVIGGLHGGHNWQTGEFVIGVEADLTASGASDTFAAWKFSNPWFGTVRARAGYALQNMLFYATGGFALGGMRVETAGINEREIHLGWAAGAGVEAGITRNVSARVEYLFIALSDRSYALTGTNHGLQSHLLRLGINYRF
jgi:outer membrane immunogenic protein